MDNLTITLEQYVKNHYGDIVEEYKRATTPHYYNGETKYYFLPSSRYVSSIHETYKNYVIKSITPSLDGNHMLNLECDTKYDVIKYSIRLFDAPKVLARVEGENNYEPIPIKRDYSVIYVRTKLNGIVTVTQEFGRHGLINKIRYGRVVVHFKSVSYIYRITCYGDEFFLDVEDAKTRRSECLRHKTVREFKEMAFNNPDIKLKCCMFGSEIML